VHGPGCGHDQAHEAPKAKKGAAKPKGKAKADEDKLVAEEPAKGSVEKASAKPKPAKPLKDAPAAKAPEAKAEPKPKTKKAPAKKG
jgi:trigger factor